MGHRGSLHWKPTQINYATPQFPGHGFLECFPCDLMEEPNFHRKHHHTNQVKLKILLCGTKNTSPGSACEIV